MRLPRLRFSLLGLMALVAYAALGCAALRYSTELWASAIFTLAVAAQMIAVLCIALRHDLARAAWIGFLVFGGGYLLLTSGLWPQTDLISNRGLAWLEQKLRPDAATAASLALTTSYDPLITAYNPNVITSSTVSASTVLLWNATTGQQISSPALTPFMRIGHGLLSPLLGLLGAWIAAWLCISPK